jgi:hypothetical protein
VVLIQELKPYSIADSSLDYGRTEGECLVTTNFNIDSGAQNCTRLEQNDSGFLAEEHFGERIVDIDLVVEELVV